MKNEKNTPKNQYCHYGCGKKSKHQIKNGNWICSKSPNACSVNKIKNSVNLSLLYENGSRKKDIPWLNEARAWSKGKNCLNDSRIKNKFHSNPELIFCEKSEVSRAYIRKLIVQNNILSYECSGINCNIKTEWLDKPITLELDHINGDNTDNRLENLRFLCPNCHSQTDTYRNKNRNGLINKSTKNKKVTNKQIEEQLKLNINKNQIAKNLNLSSGSATYNRIKKIERKLNALINEKCKKCNSKIHNRGKTGLCLSCAHLLRRKCQRPSYEELKKDLESSNYSAVGRKYNVSDNAIRKWLNQYKKNI